MMKNVCLIKGDANLESLLSQLEEQKFWQTLAMHPAHGVQVSSWHFWSGLAGPVAQCSRLSAHHSPTLEHCVCQETAKASKAVQPLKQPHLISEGSRHIMSNDIIKMSKKNTAIFPPRRRSKGKLRPSSSNVNIGAMQVVLPAPWKRVTLLAKNRKWNHATMQCLWANGT